MKRIATFLFSFLILYNAASAKKHPEQKDEKILFEKTIVVKDAVERSGSSAVPAAAASYKNEAMNRYVKKVSSELVAGANSIPNNEIVFSVEAAVNLTPYQPSGWSGIIVVYKNRVSSDGNVPTSLSESTTIFPTDSVFVAFALVNNGTDAINTTFNTKFYVDDVEVFNIPLSQINGGYFQAYWNGNVGLLAAGSHSLKVTVDANNTISETNESDNSYTRQKTISGISIVSPAGGETWPAGSVQEIKFSATTASSVDIHYKKTTETSWHAVATGYPASAGSYRWVTRIFPGEYLQIRVRDANDTLTESMSKQFLVSQVQPADPNWSVQLSSADYKLISIKAVDANTAFVIGKNNSSGYPVVLKTTDGGTNWSGAVGNLPAVELYALEAQSASVAWVGDGNGNIYKTTNGGANWNLIYSFGAFIDGIKLVGSNLVAVSDGNSTTVLQIVYSTDGGSTWLSASVPNVSGMNYSYPNNMDVVGNILFTGTSNGSLLKSTDGGKNWSAVSSALAYNYGVSFADANNGITLNAAAYNNVWKSSNGGVNGTLELNVAPNAYSVQLLKTANPYIGWITGSYGLVLKTTDGGNSWNQLYTGLGQEMYSLAFTSENNGWVITSEGSIVKYSLSSTSAAITSFTPSSGVIGSSVTISGNNFGANQGTVKFGTVTALVTSWDNTSIVATVPIGLSIGSSYTISVTVNGQTVNSATQFSVTSGTALQTPSLSTPSNGAQVTPPVMLRWLSVPNATVYDIEFGALVGSTMRSKTLSSITNSQVVDTLAAGTTYSWRVRARSTVALSVWTSYFTFTTAASQTIQQQIPAQFPSSPGASTDYRLITFPASSATPVSSLLSGEAKTDYRIFRDNGGTPPNHLAELSANNSLTAGEGYWLVKKGNFVINQQSINLRPPVNGVVSISIRSNSWNIIGNPYTVPVQWSEVRLANGLPGGAKLYFYGGFNGFDSTTTMKPFTGYYYFNAGASTTLNIPYPFSYPLGSVRNENESPVQIGIVYFSSLNNDASTLAGIDARAKKELDEFDSRKPPMFEDQGSVYFNRPEWDEKHSQFASDVRPELGEGQSWNFVLQHPAKGPAQLKFTGLEKLPDGYSAALIDNAAKSISYLAYNAVVAVPGAQKEKSFTLLVGKSEYIKQQTEQYIPIEYQLMQNYPNPFNPTTTIAYSVPKESRVTLKVFDVLGREVAALVNGVLSQGQYTVLLDATSLSSGMYFYRLEASPIDGRKSERVVLTKKLVVTK